MIDRSTTTDDFYRSVATPTMAYPFLSSVASKDAFERHAHLPRTYDSFSPSRTASTANVMDHARTESRFQHSQQSSSSTRPTPGNSITLPPLRSIVGSPPPIRHAVPPSPKRTSADSSDARLPQLRDFARAGKKRCSEDYWESRRSCSSPETASTPDCQSVDSPYARRDSATQSIVDEQMCRNSAALSLNAGRYSQPKLPSPHHMVSGFGMQSAPTTPAEFTDVRRFSIGRAVDVSSRDVSHGAGPSWPADGRLSGTEETRVERSPARGSAVPNFSRMGTVERPSYSHFPLPTEDTASRQQPGMYARPEGLPSAQLRDDRRMLATPNYVHGPPPYIAPPAYDYHGSRSRKRSNLPKSSTEIMKRWFNDNIHNPYPSEEQKKYFAAKADINLTQVSNWFINHRRRCPELKDRRDKHHST